MTPTKYIALFVGLAAVVSLGGSYALMQDNHSSNGIQQEGMKTLGHLTLVAYASDGSIKAYRQTDNLVVNNGDNQTANKIFGTALTTTSATQNVFNSVAVGTGVAAPTTMQTALGTQAGHKLSAAVTTPNPVHGQAVLTATFGAGRITNSSVTAITESGIFDNTAGSNLVQNNTNMFARQTFSAINVGPTDSLQLTWTITIT